MIENGGSQCKANLFTVYRSYILPLPVYLSFFRMGDHLLLLKIWSPKEAVVGREGSKVQFEN